MSLQDHREFWTTTPAATIAGASPEAMRIWRQRGALGSLGGPQARFSPSDLLIAAFRQVLPVGQGETARAVALGVAAAIDNWRAAAEAEIWAVCTAQGVTLHHRISEAQDAIAEAVAHGSVAPVFIDAGMVLRAVASRRAALLDAGERPLVSGG